MIFEVPFPSYFCQTVRIVFQYDMWHKKGGANFSSNYQLSSKSACIIMYLTILYQLRVGNTVSKHRWANKLQNFPEAAPPAPKPMSYLLVYSIKWVALGSSQGLVLLGFFPYALSFSQSLINADNFLVLSMKRLWSSNILWFWATWIPKSDPKISICVLLELKYFFSNPRRLRFLAIPVSDTKMSTLTLCFWISFL